MRTSKSSRETTRLINALSTTRRTRSSEAPFSVRHNYASIHESTHDAPIKAEKTGVDLESESEASSIPSDDDNSAPIGKPPPSRKRKRAATGASAPTKSSYFTAPTTTPKPTNGQPKKPRRQPSKRITNSSGEVKIEAPTDWEILYNLTKEMRKTLLAPVDTMGCERLADTNASPRDQRFQTLISLMLSSQTKDTVTAAAISNLMRNLEGGLTLESVLAVEPETLNDLIGKVGFHNTKTKSIKRTALLLRDNFASDIPDTIEGLVSLPGVGPKMAYLCMSAAWGRDEGIGVDVHVHRITNLWGWHRTKTPEETRTILEGWLPRDKWHEINTLLVGLGQTICLPEIGRRKCGECDLGVGAFCPARKVGIGKASVKREVQVEGIEGDAVLKKEEHALGETNVHLVTDIEDLGIVPRSSRGHMRKS
jgi:endonuclease-3